MTKRELHHHPDPCPPAPCPPPRPCIACWVTFIFLTISVAISPIIIFISIQIWYNAPKPPPPYVLDEIYACADLGPLHGRGLPNDRRGRTGYTGPHPGLASAVPGGPDAGRPGPPPNPRLPGIDPSSELCRAVKAIVDQSIDHDAIAELVAEEVCEKCKPEGPVPPEPPLVLGGDSVTIKIDDNIPSDCSGDVITGITINSSGGVPDTVFDAKDLDLPQFCPGSYEHILGPNNNRRLLNPNGVPPNPDPTREWELLERPRVHHARTLEKPLIPEEPVLVGGPYVVFIAKHLAGICCDEEGRHAVRDKERITVFVLYLDWVTEQPTIIEFDVEVERGKDVVSEEDTVQLISNVRLDSLDQQITFQIGRGARRIVVAGYDFSGQSTDTDVGRRRRSEEDTSGSYRIDLTDDGAVTQVYRLP